MTKAIKNVKIFFMRDKILTCLLGVAIFLLIITFGISLPIYCRFFYYLQIEPLNIPKITGYSYDQIKQAYDQVLDYLTLGGEFGTGVFNYTQSGMEHFQDCKVLFNLNIIIFSISLVITVTLLILNKTKVIRLCRPFGMHVAFISAVSIFIFFLILIPLVAIDFDVAFTVFHKIFFPGKDNWQFTYQDEIIKALPQEFFLSCAVLIGSAIVITSLTIIIFQLIKKYNAKK